jgi:cobalt-zinc-cadmium efflux system membrane fusion protein
VAQGTLLLSLQSPELARLKADWLGSRARLDRLEAELAREQRLFEAGAGSRRELDQARSERDTGRAEEEAARLALEARGLRPEEAGASFPIRALKAGRVGAWKVLVGQGVEAGQELGSFQSAQASLARVELPLPGPGGWSPGSQTEARNAQGQRWKARVEGVPASLSTDTKRLAYRLRLEGASLPLPGSPLEVRVPLEKAIILPQAAVQQVEGRWGVFVKEGEEARFRPVRRGPELGGDVMILEGLRPGQDVAVEGAYLLKALQLKRTRPEEDGHGH